MQFRLLVEQCLELSRSQIEAVAGSDDSHSKRAQRQLTPLRNLLSIVESYAATVYERDSAASLDGGDLALNDHRSILVDSQPHHLTVRCDRDEQPIQAATLREMRVDQRSEAEQPESRTDVLLDELPFIVDFIAGEGELSECSCPGARSANDATPSEMVPDRFSNRRSAQRRDQLYLVSAAEKDAARSRDRSGDGRVVGILAVFDAREDDVASFGPDEIALPAVRACSRVARRGGDSDDGASFDGLRALQECAQCCAPGSGRAADENEGSLSAARMPVGVRAGISRRDVYVVVVVFCAAAHR